MASDAVKVKNLSVQFGDFFAVKDVSFSVPKGEIFGFLGANGAGKTTTIRVLCGLIPPTAGDIEVAGEKFEKSGAKLKLKVGYMSQKFTLYDDLTVAENLSLTADLRRMSRVQKQSRQKELLEFIQWDRPLDTMIKDLPGGQKQQISLIASIIHDPDIVFLDEPTAGVSPKARARFWELIGKISSQGKTVFVTTHYMDEAEQCGRIALMRSGELIALDTPKNLKLQTFPNGLVELDPKTEISQEEIERVKAQVKFSLFEPYGSRYHGELSHDPTPQEKQLLEQFFTVQSIAPSLEDAFIRIVEGVNR